MKEFLTKPLDLFDAGNARFELGDYCKMSQKTLAPVALTLLTAACANVADVKLPEGETNLSCGAAIFAATNLVDSGGLSKDEMSAGNTTALVTKYATAYAKEEKIQDGMEAFNRVKIEAYRVDKKSSAATIANRARKCAGQPVKE